MQIIAIKGSYFNILANSDASANAVQSCLVSKERVLSAISCLSACSLNTDCLTAVYNTIDFECFFFKDQLCSNDIVASTHANLYLKKSSKFGINCGNRINKLNYFIKRQSSGSSV